MKIAHLHKVYLKDIRAGLVTVLVAYALSYLPYSDILQSIWVLGSCIYLSTQRFAKRLNETDDYRHKRLQEERFNFWQKKDQVLLKTLFSHNLTEGALAWIDQELDIPLSTLKEVHALDSLSYIKDKPGYILVRAGILLGEWNAAWQEDEQQDKLVYFQGRLQQWIKDHKHLLGEEIKPGMYLCKLGEDQKQKPIGIHMLTQESKVLVTLEQSVIHHNDDESEVKRSLSISFSSEFTSTLSTDEWKAFKQELFTAFPMLKRVNGGSGSQSQHIPFFIQPTLKAEYDEDFLKEKCLQFYDFYQTQDS